MTQPRLIEQILKDTGLDSDNKRDVKPKFTPSAGSLHDDPDGPLFNAKWNYQSIIGKLNFLAMNTRIDLAYAVHQCARYANNPKQIHQEVVKHICQYLWHTRSKGMHLQPNGIHCLEAYVDSNFCGCFHKDHSHVRHTALSRAGYIITYAGCPLLWTSRLQTEVALSSCEAEFIAMSMCARALIPLCHILAEITATFCPAKHHATLTKPGEHSTPIICKQHQSIVHEDNMGALQIALSDAQYRPRTRHISVKWHRFCDHIRSQDLTVCKVSSAVQWADILTKSLTCEVFEQIRKLSMRW